MLSGVPFGAEMDDTAEFMLGDVTVTVVLMESNGQIDPSTEDWTTESIQAVKDSVEEGLQWWVDTLDAQGSVHALNFDVDYTYADNPVSTKYEPISRDSDGHELWVDEFLDYVGFATSEGRYVDIRAFNHAQREARDTDWAFTIFVVNSDADTDDNFAPGGFQGAFAFAGGRFFVTPSQRGGITFAHETAHMFWARDEYPGSGSYDDYRGYYNTQNLNARDDHPDGGSFLPDDSIMYSGQYWTDAYDNHTSSPSSLEMIGWRDSDGNGVFDVLDVPHTLEGSGYFDPDTQAYHFEGFSSVQALPNLNPEGLQNDITINKISRAQYRLDGGDWTDAAVYNTYTADLDLHIESLPAFDTIEIRTIDDATQVTSPVFTGYSDRPSATLSPGVNGMVWQDTNANGQWDPGEAPLEGWSVNVLDADGNPLPDQAGVEPDFFSHGTVLTAAETPGVTLSSIGETATDGQVGVRTVTETSASTGTRVFGAKPGASWSSYWTTSGLQLRMDFDTPVTTLSIDAISNSHGALGRLEIYDAADNLLGRYTTEPLANETMETMTLSRPTAQIAYAIARGHADTRILLDNLTFGAAASAVADASGFYSVANLLPGDYTVQVNAPASWTSTSPANGTWEVALAPAAAVDEVDFGLLQVTVIAWQNDLNFRDVNKDGSVSPIDALQIINSMNADGPRLLPPLPTEPNVPPPYYDVNGDGYISPIDALQVLNFLNLSNASVGSRVWLDVDGNGNQDEGESGVEGVTVELFAEGKSSPMKTTATSATGDYMFVNVPPGDYYLRFGKPAGHSFTREGTWQSDDMLDSDADQQTGKTNTFSLIADQADKSQAAGLVEDFVITVENKTVKSDPTQTMEVPIDVYFEVPGAMQQKLAGYTLYVNVLPSDQGVTFGSPQLPDNPVFPGQLPTAGGGDFQPFTDILPGQFEENVFLDGMDLFRMTIQVAPGTSGTFEFTITSAALPAGGAEPIDNYVLQPGTLTVNPPGAGEPEPMPPLVHPIEEIVPAEGEPRTIVEAAAVDSILATEVRTTLFSWAATGKKTSALRRLLAE